MSIYQYTSISVNSFVKNPPGLVQVHQRHCAATSMLAALVEEWQAAVDRDLRERLQRQIWELGARKYLMMDKWKRVSGGGGAWWAGCMLDCPCCLRGGGGAAA